MGTLGQQLAHNIEREKQAKTDSNAAAEQMRTAEARKAFNAGKSFFEKAKLHVTEGIMRGDLVKDLFLQVGGRHFSPSGLDVNDEFSDVFAGYKTTDNQRGPDSLYDPKRLSALWSEFQKWANDEGLVAAWHYCWDGGGMDSWWQLRVTPKA